MSEIDKSRLNRQKFMQKRIPTILGLGVLIVAMVAGVLLFSQGTGVFAPRATPQTTPKKVKITNVTDTSFTVSFVTDESVPSFVKYGNSADQLKNQSGDDRDQISGSVQPYTTHHITVRGLNPTTSYYFTIGTGNNNTFTNQGEPFTVKTAQRTSTQTAAKTIYGSITTESGTPADGAIVYVKHQDAGELSSLVKSSGSWAIPFSNARKTDGSGYATTADEDIILVAVQGTQFAQTAQITTSIANAQPVETIKYGQTTASIPPGTEHAPEITATEEGSSAPETASASASSAQAGSATGGTTESELVTTASASAVTTIDIQAAKAAETVVTTTTQPTITGTAVPNVVVTIEVHSETEIVQQVTADASGKYSLDLAALSKNLEPGDHTVTFTYTDPTTGQAVTDTVSFRVTDTSSQLALANQPYGSGNPYPIPTPTPSPSPSPSPTASASASPSPSASSSATATSSARPTLPATDSAIPVSGSVGTTLALVFGGLFFIIAGVWSFWISSQLQKGKLEL
jgi:hypothetical protein